MCPCRWPPGRPWSCSGETAPARRPCCECSRRCCARMPGEVTVLDRRLPRRRMGRCVGASGCSGHEPLLYRELTATREPALSRTPARCREDRVEEVLAAVGLVGSRRGAAEDTVPWDGAACGHRPCRAARPRAAAARRAVGESRSGGAGAGRAADRRRNRPGRAPYSGDLQSRPERRAGRGRPRAGPARRPAWRCCARSGTSIRAR